MPRKSFAHIVKKRLLKILCHLQDCLHYLQPSLVPQHFTIFSDRNGDLTLALDPHQAPEMPSATESLDLSADERDADVTEPKRIDPRAAISESDPDTSEITNPRS